MESQINCADPFLWQTSSVDRVSKANGNHSPAGGCALDRETENKLKQQTVVHGEGKGSVGGSEGEVAQAEEVHLCTSPGRET